jgi:hypothetical protein
LVNKQAKDDSVLFEPLTDVAKTITPKLKKHQTILDKIDKETKRVKEKINQEN